MLVHQGELDDDQQSLLNLIRTKGFSVKYMGDTKKEELRRFLFFLQVEKGMSLNDVAVLVGNKTSGYNSWLYRQLGIRYRPFEEARLKGIRDKRRKYERKPFDGTDEDRAYLLGLRHGDLSVSKPWKNVLRVSTSTTHPAMANLFRSLFEPYGHVYQHPRYKKDTKSYEWNLLTILDESFEFLFLKTDDIEGWLASDPRLTSAYLSGFLDAEGSITIAGSVDGYILPSVCYNNSNLDLLKWVQSAIESLGFKACSCLNKKKGTRTKKYGILMRKDYWQLSIYGRVNGQSFLRTLCLRHEEKQQRLELVLTIVRGERYSTISADSRALVGEIKARVREFVKKAELEYLTKHISK